MTKSASMGHHHAPAHHHHPSHTPQKHGHGGLIAALIGAMITLAAAGMWLGRETPPDPTETLLEQVRDAAQGTVAPVHAFGGGLTAIRSGGRIHVIAQGLPSKACVQVGWRLAREGTVIVDGVLPVRLSAAKLAELCAGDGATLTWIPTE
jgi:hypothetical protein